MPASRAGLTSSRIWSSVFSAMRMSPSTTFGATISVPGRVKVFMMLLMIGVGQAACESSARTASSSAVRESSAAAHGVLDALRPRGARDRDDDGRERELPRERDLLRADPALVGELLERGVLPAHVAGSTDAAERRPRQEGDAERGAVLELGEARAERRGELVLHRDEPPSRIAFASSIWATFAFEIPAISITPSSSRSRMAPIESAYGTFGSGRWNW